MDKDLVNNPAHGLGDRRAKHSDILSDLRGKRFVSDECFEELLSREMRSVSAQHWTPMHIIFRAVDLLVVNSKTRVLDVGSGCGKFCVVGSLISNAFFTGIEQRKSLIDSSTALAKSCSATRANFIHGDIGDVNWSHYNAFYLYNPFCENIYRWSKAIDESVPLSNRRYLKHIRTTERRLRFAPIGTRVVAYQGFGGTFPAGYKNELTEYHRGRDLELWIKTAEPAA